jgi:hypothetical protein
VKLPILPAVQLPDIIGNNEDGDADCTKYQYLPVVRIY